MAEATEDKIRRVYRAQKRRHGSAARRGEPIRSAVRNEARLATARVVGVPVAEVKRVLAESAGPQTTASPAA